MDSVEQIIKELGLSPHPAEGGYFAETYQADETLVASALPARYCSQRAHSTAIYYLLTPDTFSAMHRLLSDEVFHFYLGDAVEMLILHPDGQGERRILGTNLVAGERPQIMVPRHYWQGSRLVTGGKFALLGTTVAPGFEYADYEHGNRNVLLEKYPLFSKAIIERTNA